MNLRDDQRTPTAARKIPTVMCGIMKVKVDTVGSIGPFEKMLTWCQHGRFSSSSRRIGRGHRHRPSGLHVQRNVH